MCHIWSGTIPILRQLKVSLHNSTGYSTTDKRILWCAFAVGFFGFLRAKELVCPSEAWTTPPPCCGKILC